MRELRINYGLSRLERSEKVEKLSRGLIEPSNSLRRMLDELETRKTAKAIGQFQASLFNPEMNSEGKQNLNTLYHRIPPHERTYLYQLSESRKYALQNTQHQNNQEKLHSPLDRERLGAMPRESDSLRKYLSSMSQIERRLLNEEIRKHCVNLEVGQDRDGLTINEARSLLPERSAREIRLRARDLAWEKIVPGEVFESNPLPETVRISDTIAHIHGHLQEKARIAQNARNDFLAEKIFEAERRVGVIDPKSDPQTKDSREKFIDSVVAGLSRDERQKLEALDIYAAQTREEVYRGFKEIDGQLRDLQQSRVQVETQKIELGDTVNHVNNASLKRSAVLVNPSHSFTHVSTTIFNPPGQREHNGRGEKILPIDININKEWHFDSLRDALKAERNGQGESEREIVKYSDHIEDHKVDLHR
jgi:hypothetical protein